ncbi:MAG TPA: hypothetical protein VG870_04585 [Chitinophagaceae bacterium]|nr:hypothetical protein [Chitinophagaceae bacterium]
MLVRIILWGLLIYVIYKFLFELLLPVYNATRELKRGFRDMQRKMDEQMKQQQAQANPQPGGSFSRNTSSHAPAGEYIDFEEVK